jgi:hypothetical protein
MDWGWNVVGTHQGTDVFVGAYGQCIPNPGWRLVESRGSPPYFAAALNKGGCDYRKFSIY